VPDFQAGELAAAGVGEERGEPVPADIGEPQLRAGVRPFPADDQPRSFRPGGQVDAAGDLGDLRAVAGLPVDVVGGSPGPGRDPEDRVLDGLVDGEPEGERAAPLPDGGGERVGGARGVGADQDRRAGSVRFPV